MRRLDRLNQKGLYRSRNGAIFGVCRGIAEYFDFFCFLDKDFRDYLAASHRALADYRSVLVSGSTDET